MPRICAAASCLPPSHRPSARNPVEVFRPSHVANLVETAQRVNTFGSVVEEPAGEAERLRAGSCHAEASQYIHIEGSARIGSTG